MADSPIIRKAVRTDCQRIRALIQELADYEKMPDGPQISVERLEEDGFGKNPFFHCFVAEISSQLVGFTLFFYTYSTWEGRSVFMEDLYVQPQHRGKGLGTKLWKSVISEGLSIGCTRCNFQVLDWNKPSIEFYEKAGAVDLSAKEGWLSFRMVEEKMKEFVNK